MENKLILPDEEPKPVLKLLPGDKEGNWLWKREVGEVFLCRVKPYVDPRTNKKVVDMGLDQYEVDTKWDIGRCVRLVSTLNEPGFIKWVDSEEFSKAVDLVCTLGKVEDNG